MPTSSRRGRSWCARCRCARRPPAARVRLVEIEGVDLQACGGTHVRSTGEIGALTVGKLENKGRQNRRISLTLVE